MRKQPVKNQEPASDYATQLGGHVTYLRKARDYSVRGLAEDAKVNATWLSRVERGLYKSPDARALLRLARALDIDVEELYVEAGYGDGRGLPSFAPYLRAKYDLPPEAIAQLEAHFQLINDHYHEMKGDADDLDHHHPAR